MKLVWTLIMFTTIVIIFILLFRPDLIVMGLQPTCSDVNMAAEPEPIDPNLLPVKQDSDFQQYTWNPQVIGLNQ